MRDRFVMPQKTEFEIWFGQKSDRSTVSGDADTVTVPPVAKSGTVVVPLASLGAIFVVDKFYVTTIACLSETVRQVYASQLGAASLEDITTASVDIANRRVISSLAEVLAGRVYDTTKEFKVPLFFEYKNGGKAEGQKFLQCSKMQEEYTNVFRNVLEYQLRQKGLRVL